jgi:hypothetical protein
LPVVEATTGLPVTEAANARGIAVTKVADRGLPVVFVTTAGVPVPNPFTNLNPADQFGMTLSNKNLTATASGLAGVRSVQSFGAGRYYWEYRFDVLTSAGISAGMATAAADLTVALLGAGTVHVRRAGGLFVDNISSGLGIGLRAAGSIVAVAVNLVSQTIWFREVSPTMGDWNGIPGADPAAGTSGLSISTLGLPLFAAIGGGLAGERATANFGATAFAGVAPFNFTAGLPAG